MEPKFIISKKEVLKNYKKFSAISHLVAYSSKTNPEITKILEKETNSYFCLHIKNELINVKDKKRIIFFAQSWNQKEIEELISQKINFFVIDNIPDLDELKNYLKNNPKQKIKLLLRMKLKERTIKTERYFVFGIDKKRINEELNEIFQNPQIEKIGIHFHRKTQNISEWDLIKEIQETITKENLEKIHYLDIGGGFPSEYSNTNIKVFDYIEKQIKELKKFSEKNNIELIIEPGRGIAAPSTILETEIINIYDNVVVVNASVYNSDLDALIVPVKLLIKEESKSEKAKEYIIKGITPCSLDLYRYRAKLINPKKGNKITFLNAGAYNFSTDFCNLEKIKTKIIE